jgi:hypothetical protein
MIDLRPLCVEAEAEVWTGGARKFLDRMRGFIYGISRLMISHRRGKTRPTEILKRKRKEAP